MEGGGRANQQGGEVRQEDAIARDNIDVSMVVLGYQDTMAVKCAVELRIPDIIHSHGSPISLFQIASHFGSSSPNLRCLASLMRFLVRKDIFTATPNSDNQSGETLYGLTNASRLLLHDSENTQVPLVLLASHPVMLDPWHKLSVAIKEGGTAFEKTHGIQLWEIASKNPEFNNLLNSALVSETKAGVEELLSAYKDGFQGIATLVDVGGGSGYFISEIVKANTPRIRGINFDLPHVVENAPMYHGVTHVGGDMFQSIPSADAIILKNVLHNWSDEDCRKILRNCRTAISEIKGKLILVEMVLQPEGKGWVNDLGSALDLMMTVYFPGGRERTQLEWTKLLEETGFSRINFVNTPVKDCIIEARPS